MNTRTTIILLVVAIALGAGMLFLFNQEQKAAQEPALAVAAKAKDLFEPKPAAIVQLRVEQPDRPARLFEQRDEEWFIAQPVKAHAQKTAVQEDARNLGDLQYIQKYASGAADFPGEELTGLKQPNMVLTIKEKDGTTHTLKVGNVRPMTEDETYISKDTDPAVYVVKQNLLTRFARPLTDLREKRLAEIPLAEITQIKAAGAQNYELVKANDEWVVAQPVRGRTDKAKVDALLQTASNLTAENYVADEASNLRIYGLAQPQLALTIVTEKKPPATQPATTQSTTTQPAATQPGEVKTTTILVGGKAGSQYFAKIDGESSIFQIPETVFKNINVPLLDLRDKAIAQVDPARVTGLNLTTNGQSVMLIKQKDRWQMAGAVVGPAESASVNDLLKTISQAKATAFEDQPKPELTSYGFEAPRVRIRIISEGRIVPVEILVGGTTPSGEMVFVQNVAEGGICVLKKADVEGMLVEPLNLLERSVFSFARDDVDRLDLVRDGQTTTLAKQGNQWRMTAPTEAPADAEAVKAILADLSSLRGRKVVAINDDARYGLTEPQVTVKVHVKDLVPATQPAAGGPSSTQAALAGATPPASSEPANPVAEAGTTQAVSSQAAKLVPSEKIYTLLVSRKDADAYARLAEGTWIYQIDPVISTHLQAELHDRAVVAFDPQQAASIRVPAETGEFLEFVRKGEQWTYLADPFVQVDAAKVKEWLNLLRNTRAERYIAFNMQEVGGFGLDKPLYEAEVTLANGKSLKLIVAKPTESGKYVATVAGSTAAFELPAGSVKQLQKTLAFFKGQ
jgi:hypothetical protein